MVATDVLLVSSGAVAGALLRYKINQLNLTPYSTVAINIAGSFLLGNIIQYTSTMIPSYHKYKQLYLLLIGTGFCGSFTTFSTFSCDVIQLLDKQMYSRAMAVIILTNTMGISAAFVGFRFMKHITAVAH